MRFFNKAALIIWTICFVGISATAAGQANPELGDMGDDPGGGGGPDDMGGGDFGGDMQTGGQAGGTWSPPTGQVSTQLPPDFEEETTSSPGGSDHRRVVGKLGIGFFGVQLVPIMRCTAAPCTVDTETSVSAPTVGVRYWLDHGMGIEAAIGFHNSSGETETVTGMASALVVEPDVLAFAIHGGLPLVLADSGHFVFEVVPFLNLGFATGTYTGATAAEDVSIGGFMLEIGGTAGAEIHFGFIDIPQLALQGSIGLSFRTESRSAEQTAAMLTVDQSSTTISTSIGGEPWDMFTGNITAIYYL